MVNDLVENILRNEIEKVEENFEKTKLYKEIMEKYHQSYGIVKNNLPEENSFHIIDELESCFNYLCNEACKYFYKQGLKDGVYIFKEFKKINIEEKDDIDITLKAIGVSNAYDKMVKDKVPTHALNKEDYIYKIAFEEGRKEGYREAIH